MESIQIFVDKLSESYLLYIKRLYKNEDNIRKFQQKLIDIPSWSLEKIEKNFKKYSIEEKVYTNAKTQLQTLISSVYIDITFKDNTEKLVEFWYKCLKKVAKFYYENARILQHKDDFYKSIDMIKEIVHKRFYKVTNINSITKYKIENKYNGLDCEKNIEVKSELFYIDPIKSEQNISSEQEEDKLVKIIY